MPHGLKDWKIYQKVSINIVSKLIRYMALRMFAANEKVFKLFSNHSFLIPKYNTRHLITK